MIITLVPLPTNSIQEVQDAVLQIQAALVMLELEAVDGVLSLQAGEAEAALDGAGIAGFQSRSTNAGRIVPHDAVRHCGIRRGFANGY
jgi:hypothetical protein